MAQIAAVDPWFTFPKRNSQARLRLFCFPYAGGGAAVFNSWPDGLPKELEVCAARLPGRERRLVEPPFTQMPLLVQTLADVILPQLHLPFAFFGHSLGALICFELAHELRKRTGPLPSLVFVSGCRAPQIPDRDKSIHQLPESEFLEELRCLNGTPETVRKNPELIQLLLPTLRADFTMAETYVYETRTPLECPISAFGGLEDRMVSRSDIAAWREQSGRSFTYRMLSGDHFFLNNMRADLLQAISHDLIRILND